MAHAAGRLDATTRVDAEPELAPPPAGWPLWVPDPEDDAADRARPAPAAPAPAAPAPAASAPTWRAGGPAVPGSPAPGGPPEPRGDGTVVFAAILGAVIVVGLIAFGLTRLLDGGSVTDPPTAATTTTETPPSPDPTTDATTPAPTEEATTPSSGGGLVAVETSGGAEGVPTADVGDCLWYAELTADDVEEFPVLDCAEEHDSEVFAVFDVAGASRFPGQEEINDLANDECIARFETYVGAPLGESSLALAGTYYTPTETTWPLDDRQVICLAHLDDGETMTGSIAGSG